MTQAERDNQYVNQQKISFFGFITELPNFIGVAISAIISGSLIVWMDFVDSLGNVVNAGFVTLLSRKLKCNLKYEYNYGIGKIEAISALCCDGILVFGLVMMLISSVYEMINPKQPSGLLIYVVLLKVINVIFDIIFLKEQYKITHNGKNELTNAKLHSELKNLAFDSVALISVFICYLFRENRYVWYFSPIICIILACVFFAAAFFRIKKSVSILTDRTLPEKEQMKILSVLSKFNDRYDKFDFLSSRISGDTVFIDLKIQFCDDTSYGQIKEFCREISLEMKKQILKSNVSIVIDSNTL